MPVGFMRRLDMDGLDTTSLQCHCWSVTRVLRSIDESHGRWCLRNIYQIIFFQEPQIPTFQDPSNFLRAYLHHVRSIRKAYTYILVCKANSCLYRYGEPPMVGLMYPFSTSHTPQMHCFPPRPVQSPASKTATPSSPAATPFAHPPHTDALSSFQFWRTPVCS